MELKDFILLIKSSEFNAHVYHWNTTSYAAHKALEGYYEAIRDSIDNFVEVTQGKLNVKLEITGTIHVSDKEASQYYSELKEVVTHFIDYKLSSYKDLENIAVEMLEEINKLNYLLTLK